MFSRSPTLQVLEEVFGVVPSSTGYFGGADYNGLLEFCVLSDGSELFTAQGEFDLVCRAVKVFVKVGEDFG